MRVAIPVQLAAILGIMLPSMSDYVGSNQPDSLFNLEIWAHHILGLAIIVGWVYINLISLGIIKTRKRFVLVMRAALIAWVLSLAMGLHLYVQIWV